MEALLIYIIVVNIAALAVMGTDKYKAQKRRDRISERSIFALGLIGGGLGVLFGMYVFRHKTRHLKFTLGIPAIVVLNVVMYWYLLNWI